MIAKFIEPFPFFAALFFGLMMCYILTPTPKIVIRHPSPENVNDIIYKDKSDNCYKYEVDEIKCPKDKDSIKKHPIDN
tara:strand:+ start:27 stop:260 length:234 start_codon:yes stop_codon:yes gene_type:complete